MNLIDNHKVILKILFFNYQIAYKSSILMLYLLGYSVMFRNMEQFYNTNISSTMANAIKHTWKKTIVSDSLTPVSIERSCLMLLSCVFMNIVKNYKRAFMNMCVWARGGKNSFTGNLWGRQSFLFSTSANQMSSALVMTTAAFQTCRAAVYSWRKVIEMLKLCTGVYKQLTAQEAYIGKLQYFVTEVFLEMGESRSCRTVPLNPSFAAQYVRRNSC